MKKLVFISILISVIALSDAIAQDKVKWYSIEQAEEMAKKNPKKILVDVYTDWCGWCKKMDQETFTHPVIAEYINENYYAVKLNAEGTSPIEFNGKTYKYVTQGNRGYHELAAGFLQGQMSFPSIAYLNEELQLLGAIPGYKTPADMEPILSFIAEDKFESQSFEEYYSSFEGKIPE